MRYCAKVGYHWTAEEVLPDGTPTSVWKDHYQERTYKADVINYGYKNQPNESINDDYKVTSKMSILACDAFTLSHLNHLIYCEYLGVKWKITSVEVQRPRLIITLGGEYNGSESETTT